MGTAGTRIETNIQKRKRLIKEAEEMNFEIQHLEYDLSATLHEINQLNPTKKELKHGLEDLMNMYYMG
jgi:uncharacterized coiled-coil DUF342 family protein